MPPTDRRCHARRPHPHVHARYLVDLDLDLDVGGAAGLVAAVLGKSPPDVRFWVSTGAALMFLKFEGAMYVDGPIWRIEPVSPSWPEQS
ncbi:MAG: hypothetical protein FJ144_27355 [Deltaproteobacteria bacterium]|nr:hypothetical protein [Deltaproteobacteria bacterium]